MHGEVLTILYSIWNWLRKVACLICQNFVTVLWSRNRNQKHQFVKLRNFYKRKRKWSRHIRFSIMSEIAIPLNDRRERWRARIWLQQSLILALLGHAVQTKGKYCSFTVSLRGSLPCIWIEYRPPIFAVLTVATQLPRTEVFGYFFLTNTLMKFLIRLV